ncbi:Beta/gamma crystallin domain-containing protein 2 [Camelus dromedarius]|uniref:Beta/gamma crystallin domain-containing protein 2 n=1 Tax=Camelus dromedarius TaxID=9838 RepID=A0A5N4DC66_CAMDR|nr:Beta/gamma crystallin domain-containing protein 2 [Camelus dromedarius]
MEEASGPLARDKARVVSATLTWRQRPPAQEEIKHRFHKVSLVSGAQLEAPQEKMFEYSHRREEVNGFAVQEEETMSHQGPGDGAGSRSFQSHGPIFSKKYTLPIKEKRPVGRPKGAVDQGDGSPQDPRTEPPSPGAVARTEFLVPVHGPREPSPYPGVSLNSGSPRSLEERRVMRTVRTTMVVGGHVDRRVTSSVTNAVGPTFSGEALPRGRNAVRTIRAMVVSPRAEGSPSRSQALELLTSLVPAERSPLASRLPRPTAVVPRSPDLGSTEGAALGQLPETGAAEPKDRSSQAPAGIPEGAHPPQNQDVLAARPDQDQDRAQNARVHEVPRVQSASSPTQLPLQTSQDHAPVPSSPGLQTPNPSLGLVHLPEKPEKVVAQGPAVLPVAFSVGKVSPSPGGPRAPAPMRAEASPESQLVPDSTKGKTLLEPSREEEEVALTADLEIFLDTLRSMEPPEILRTHRLPRAPRSSYLAMYATLPAIEEDQPGPWVLGPSPQEMPTLEEKEDEKGEEEEELENPYLSDDEKLQRRQEKAGPSTSHSARPPQSPALKTQGKLNTRPGKMILFSEPGCQGSSRDVWEDTADASGWACVASIRVVRGCWVLYEEPEFQGRKLVLPEGDVELGAPGPAWSTQGIGSLRRVVRDYITPEISLYSEEGLKGQRVKLTEALEDPQHLERPLQGCPSVEKPGEPKAVVYEAPDFQGQSWEVSRDIYNLQQPEDSQSPHLASVGSLRVLGGCWVGYEKEGFRGHQYLLEEGEYADWSHWGGYNEALTSLRVIRTDFGDPALVLFEAMDFEGHGVEVSEALRDVELAGHAPRTQAIHVLSGVWVAYQEVGFSGEQYVLEKGVYRNCDDWGAGNSALASLQPVLQIQLFSGPDFLGDHISFEDDQTSLPSSFQPQSCRVLGGSWILFDEKNFEGEQHILSEGEFPTLTAMGCLASTVLGSLRRVPLHFSEPSILLYGLECFEGKEIELSREVRSLQAEGFNNHVLSVWIKGGVWVLCEHSDFRGRQWLVGSCEITNWLTYSGTQRVGSLYPIKQRRAYFRLWNEALGGFLAVPDHVEDMKAGRVVVSEPRAGGSCIWYHEDGLLKNQVAPTMSLQVIGPPSTGSKVVLWAESRLPRQTWSIDDSGHICSQMFEGRILDVKGGRGYDRDHAVLWELAKDRASQIWAVHVL